LLVKKIIIEKRPCLLKGGGPFLFFN